jgi:hypothetical protein
LGVFGRVGFLWDIVRGRNGRIRDEIPCRGVRIMQRRTGLSCIEALASSPEASVPSSSVTPSPLEDWS